MEFEAQTRDGDGACVQHPTVAAAFQYAADNPSVWKVSFNAENGERVRLVQLADHRFHAWCFEPIVLPVMPVGEQGGSNVSPDQPGQ